MVLALGIDTGGTFTDSVIYQLAEGTVVVKAKAPTTYNDFARGIRNSINKMAFKEFEKIRLVSLSTTMATNAIVEGRGCEVGLILIGEKPNGPLPVRNFAVVRGGHDIKGNPREELDPEEVEQALEAIKDNVEAFAVSGFASVRNPEHELRIKELIEKKYNLPVVCGHQLTTSLGFHERSVTAALNAKLIPIIRGLINSVKSVLAELKINDAQLMVVKGDGTLMNVSTALEKPIETILSGPAASIIGATVLTDLSHALVLDMGGTTTDIAVLKNGVPRINPEGATVGGWLTRVEAANIYTYG
ncbi:MAG TPA: hydantoinase/oxoprolinase family protein, partial [Desulfobacteria bacterium]|nr:hydantoinase/oxoprolinase family protein [Desulfobacteria bacterium]